MNEKVKPVYASEGLVYSIKNKISSRHLATPMVTCVQNVLPANADSEMEEGEIVDDLDDLSDISSEEEFLLRQRLQVLENYNNVLERKKAKNSNCELGKKPQEDASLQELSEISDAEENFSQVTDNKICKPQNSKLQHKQKKKKDIVVVNVGKHKDHKRKAHRPKKKPVPKVLSESSEESEDEYRNKRRKLAEAVSVTKENNDTSSLKARLNKMLCPNQNYEAINAGIDDNLTMNVAKNDPSILRAKLEKILCLNRNNKPTKAGKDNITSNVIKNNASSLKARIEKMLCENKNKIKAGKEGHIATTTAKPLDWSLNSSGNSDNTQNTSKKSCDETITIEDLDISTQVYELIDLCKDDDVNDVTGQDCVDSVFVENNKEVVTENLNKDSDDDLELLREHALKSKATKIKTVNSDKDTKLSENKTPILSEDEDSDTAELRLICLKSALLKKAIEMKQKQKLRKRLSHSFHDDFDPDSKNWSKNVIEVDNNTDIESVDMDIGSDGDEKLKDYGIIEETKRDAILQKDIKFSTTKEDETEEDEDLLRANLLTSLSKNLPNLIHPNMIDTINEIQNPDKSDVEVKNIKNTTLPEPKPLIIKLGESDSEGEHEATKNLTKMHMKLSEQIDFQQKLDLFLKSTRMEVEKKALPDVVQGPSEQPKPAQKYVAKTVKHLPKCEQIEYKNLVKRMAELEKIKQTRQSLMNISKLSVQAKDTLKPRNITIEAAKNSIVDNIEDQIALSRKIIAEESLKMLKLKEEATKLSQKYKIVATELRNITTAITFNKKQQKTVQNKLSTIRSKHQMLLKRSPSKHSKISVPLVNRPNSKSISATKLQKENNPTKDDYKNPHHLKSVKVSVVNDLKDETVTNPRLSVRVDVSSNKKIVKMPKNTVKGRTVLNVENMSETVNVEEMGGIAHPAFKRGGGSINSKAMIDANDNDIGKCKEVDDYTSPLGALHAATWVEDPNSILCPFEVGGTCKDPDCKNLHPKIPSDL